MKLPRELLEEARTRSEQENSTVLGQREGGVDPDSRAT